MTSSKDLPEEYRKAASLMTTTAQDLSRMMEKRGIGMKGQTIVARHLFTCSVCIELYERMRDTLEMETNITKEMVAELTTDALGNAASLMADALNEIGMRLRHLAREDMNVTMDIRLDPVKMGNLFAKTFGKGKVFSTGVCNHPRCQKEFVRTGSERCLLKEDPEQN